MPASDLSIARKARTRSPSRAAGVPPLNKRELQKLRTKRELLKAGREVYISRGLDSPTIEDVTNAAGVSRASFYLHYESREAHIIAVFEREIRRQMRLYRSMTPEDIVSVASIRAWIDQFCDRFRPERQVILITYRALSMDPRNLVMIYQSRRRMVAKVARRVPDLRIIRRDGTVDHDRFAEMYEIFNAMESLSLFSAFDAINEEREFVVNAVVNRIAQFCNV